MVRPPRSRYKAHPQVRYQECLLYSSLHRLLTLRSFSPSAKSLNSQQAPKLDRRKELSNRAAAAMFVTTVMNFILFSLNTGTQVAVFITSIRKALVLDIDYPLSVKPDMVSGALPNMSTVANWAISLAVSVELSLLDPVSIARRRYCSAISLSFGGLGPSFLVDSG